MVAMMNSVVWGERKGGGGGAEGSANWRGEMNEQQSSEVVSVESVARGEGGVMGEEGR